MSFASYRRRFGELTWKDRILLAEAVGTLAVASIAIRLMPFRKVVGALTAPTFRDGRDNVGDFQTIARTRWAIEACARLLPWRIVCFQKGLALYRMLHHRGIPCLLHYGVAQDEQRGLRAHVWLTYEGEAIIGAEEAPHFACLATYPDAGRSSDAAMAAAAGRITNR